MDQESLSRSAAQLRLSLENTLTNAEDQPTPKLPKAAQPPLAYGGATPDSDRAKRPPLSEPSPTGEELALGDRVENLGNFGKQTGELGTVKATNEEDALVKWDKDGFTRIHKPSLKKI